MGTRLTYMNVWIFNTKSPSQRRDLSYPTIQLELLCLRHITSISDCDFPIEFTVTFVSLDIVYFDTKDVLTSLTQPKKMRYSVLD